MKKRKWLYLLLFMTLCSCTTEAEVYEGGRVVPCDTADGYSIYIRVDYSFRYHMGDSKRDSKVQRDIVELLAINASGIIGSKTVVNVLPNAEKYTLEEIESMVHGDPSENQMLLELRKVLKEEESLEEVEIVSMTMSLVDIPP
jgi:hypothetical protein